MRIAFHGLWQHNDFMKLWAGQTISKIGSYISGEALAFTAILLLGASPVQMGFLAAAGAVPVLVFGLVAGVWVDRLRRKPILIAADLGRAFILGSIPLAVFAGALRIEQLYLVAALAGVLTVFFDVAYQSYLPSLVKRKHMVEANSKLGMSGSVAEIAGPSLGGVLVQIIGPALSVLIDAVSFLLSALSLGLIRTKEVRNEYHEERENMLREAKEGLQVVLQSPILRPLLLSSVQRSMFGNIIGTLYMLYLVEEVGVGPALVGILISAGGIGALVGAFITGPLTRRYGLGKTLLVAQGISTILTFSLLATGPALLVFGIFLFAQLFGDAAYAVNEITALSVRQMVTPDRLLGRAIASMHMLEMGIGPAGAIAGGVLGELVGMRAALLVACTGIFLANLWVIFSPIRHLNEQALAEPQQ